VERLDILKKIQSAYSLPRNVQIYRLALTPGEIQFPSLLERISQIKVDQQEFQRWSKEI